jgi:hypothetical protein
MELTKPESCMQKMSNQHYYESVALYQENAKALNISGACNSCVAELILVNSEHLSSWRMAQHAP